MRFFPLNALSGWNAVHFWQKRAFSPFHRTSRAVWHALQMRERPLYADEHVASQPSTRQTRRRSPSFEYQAFLCRRMSSKPVGAGLSDAGDFAAWRTAAAFVSSHT